MTRIAGNIFAVKKMKKKKIIFSSSGGTPAMKFIIDLFEQFGHEDITRIAAQIAATCSKSRVTVTALLYGGILELQGNTAKSIERLSDTVLLQGENLSVENNTLCII